MENSWRNLFILCFFASVHILLYWFSFQGSVEIENTFYLLVCNFTVIEDKINCGALQSLLKFSRLIPTEITSKEQTGNS